MIVREVSERSRSRQQRHFGHSRKLSDGLPDPIARTRAVDGHAISGWFGQQAAAQFGLLVTENDACARLAGGQCRGEPSGTCANNQHVAVREAVGITIRIRLRRGDAQARSGTDPRLVERVPRALRPHECLVVEARGNERRDQIVDGADVEVEARPAILALRLQSLIQLNLCCPQVRYVSGGVTPDSRPVRWALRRPLRRCRAAGDT